MTKDNKKKGSAKPMSKKGDYSSKTSEPKNEDRKAEKQNNKKKK